MNIAFLSTAFLRNMKESTAITTISMAKELMKMGHKVFVVTEKRDGYPEFEKIDGVSVYRMFKGKILGHGKTVDYLQRKLRIKFDVLHGFSAAPGLVLRTVFAKKYCKKAKTIHTIKSYPKKFGGFSWLLNKVDLVTVSTEVMKKKLVAKGVKESKIKVIRSFIDLRKFNQKNKIKLKKKYDFSSKKVVFYYGSLFEKKGVKFLLKGLPAVFAGNPNAVFVMAVRHKVTEDYIDLIEDLGIKYRVKVITSDIDVADYVNLADVVVLPYVDMVGTEGNPSCLLEAVACKTPVVTTMQAELAEIFNRDEVFYAVAANRSSLAEKINFVLENEKEAKKFALRAFKKIKNFDVRKVAREFLKLYGG